MNDIITKLNDEKNLEKKKKLVYIIIASIILLVIICISTILILNSRNSTKIQPESKITQIDQADDLKTKAIEAIRKDEDTKANNLLKEANEEYKEAGDGTNVVDTNTLLCLQGQKEYCPTPTE